MGSKSSSTGFVKQEVSGPAALKNSDRSEQIIETIKASYHGMPQNFSSKTAFQSENSSPAKHLQRSALRLLLGSIVKCSRFASTTLNFVEPRGVQRLQQKLRSLGRHAIKGYQIASRHERVLLLQHRSQPHEIDQEVIRTNGMIEGLYSWGYEIFPVVYTSLPASPADQGACPDDATTLVNGIPYRIICDTGIHKSETEGSKSYFDNLCAIVEDLRPSIIHVDAFRKNVQVALELRDKYGIPVIFDVRELSVLINLSKHEAATNSEASTAGGSNQAGSVAFPDISQYQEFCETLRFADAADRVLCPSEALARLFRSFGISEEKISLLPSCETEDVANRPLLPSKIQERSEVKYLGYHGGLEPWEGLEDLCSAVEILAETRPDLKINVVFAGVGSHEEFLRRRITRSAHKDRFEITPSPLPDQVDNWYARCAAVVYPRRSYAICEMTAPVEPLGAMARGIPVISSDVEGFSEISGKGEKMFVFKAGDSRSLADSIAHVLSNPKALERVRSQAKEYIQKDRTWRVGTHQLGRVYRNLHVEAQALSRSAFTGKPHSFKVVELAEIPIAPDLKDPETLRPSDAARLSYTASLIPSNSRVLDVGVGRGHFLKLLLDSGKAAEGFGIDIMFYGAVQKRLERAQLQTMSITDIKFADASFDVVTCFEVIEHLDWRLLEPALYHLRRVCRKELLISVPFKENLPISRYHRQRFSEEKLKELFPSAEITILNKIEPNKTPWALIRERMT